MEHAGTLSFIKQKLDRSLDNLRNQGSYERIRDVIIELNSVLERIFYGTGIFEGNKFKKVLHVNELIKNHLHRELSDAWRMYGYLSEFVHPNYGSNVLVSSGELGEGVIDPTLDEKKEIISGMLLLTI